MLVDPQITSILNLLSGIFLKIVVYVLLAQLTIQRKIQNNVQ